MKNYRDATVFGGGGNIPFSLYQGKLYTFHGLAEEGSRLSTFVEKESIAQIETEYLTEDNDTRRIVSELLRKTVEAHMAAKGLQVERRRQRAHFNCDSRNKVEIPYQSAGRKFSRKVAWWAGEPKPDYCIHTAVHYEIERFGEIWGLILNPSFLVTRDGKTDQLDRNEHARIVTKLQSDHYNTHVRADVRFWLSFLETNDGEINLSYQSNRDLIIDTHPIQHEGYSRGD